MDESVFCERFFTLAGERMQLRLIDTYVGDGEALPFYWWEIVLQPENVAIGKISLRIGHNRHSYYNGNIGYEIDDKYRGHHYALAACRLVLPVARYHGMTQLCLTCDHDNIASWRTMERLGAVLVEEACPPEDYLYYYEGMPRKRIYRLDINTENIGQEERVV